MYAAVTKRKEILMDTQIISVIVDVAGDLLRKVVDWIGSRKDPDADENARKVVEKVYETLKTNLAPHCVKILKLLEIDDYQPPSEIRKYIHPNLNMDKETEEKFDGEFRYRLEYMRQNGVIAFMGGNEYRLTRLGQAFLAKARSLHDYPSVLGKKDTL
jgi:hypothetical protein